MNTLIKPNDYNSLGLLQSGCLGIYFFISSILLEPFCSPATAGQSQPSSSMFAITQGRIGLGVSGEYTAIDAGLKLDPPPTLGNIALTQSQTAKKFQIAPHIEFGITIADDYYLGFLASWQPSGLKNTSRSPIRGAHHFLHDLKLNDHIDLFLKPGYKLTPSTMIYGLIGPSLSRWSHMTEAFSYNSLTGVTKSISQFKTDKNSTGLAAGLGFEYLLKNQFAFSIDYCYHFQQSISQKGYMSYLDPIPMLPPEPNIDRVRYGDILKVVEPSYSVITIRFTAFLSL